MIQVAILCNHQRSVSKSHGAQMEKLETKMTELEVQILNIHLFAIIEAKNDSLSF